MNESVKNVLNDVQSNILDNYIYNLQQRIDKAIDYLKSDNYWLSQVKANDDLLNILKGE